ncbi:uncharacterized protein LAJ45_00778 [Morchella importuna]|uniref:uncharacterized protein n=1 Tax=Morchella importuna TaxID=1174673 RepID=UPI001E8D7A4D|nr:uncharacterized protein LAJ45_00778 [Morchella importuna]KAH8155768.1 hypothetical protein LAJ45_00778 [Morchella importuna]
MQDIESELLAPEKIYLKGVDSMSTANVKSFASTHFTAAPILKVEWIDDSSCCLVYRTPTEAAEALRALALDDEELPALTLRPARLAASHPDSRLEVRVARQSDKKIAASCTPPPRTRRIPPHPPPPHRQRRARPRLRPPPLLPREHDRRRTAADSSHTYTNDFYDDDDDNTPSSRNSRNVSRDRSYSPRPRPRPRTRTRSRSPIELFPNRSRNRELFPERAAAGERGRLRSEEGSSGSGGGGGRVRSEPVELFPRRPAASSRFEVSPSPGPGPVELFPGRGGGVVGPVKKSLEERINLDSSGDGFRIKGRGGQGGGGGGGGGDDLFAQKLRAAKGEGLVVEEGGRRRGGARRNRAEDMFG